MADTAITRLARSRSRDLRRSVGGQLHDLRLERELSQREVAGAAHLDRALLSRAEAGDANLTLASLAALATALGTEPSLRLYPSTGPRLRDHLQARILAVLLEALRPRWTPHPEVPVYRPARGVIDLVLVEVVRRLIVSSEAHSELRSAERQLRWAAQKTDSLPSATAWPWGIEDAAVSRLLVLRSTAATRALVADAAAVFRAAYPARSDQAVASLAGDVPYPGPAVVWVEVNGRRSRLLPGAPRGVPVGR